MIKLVKPKKINKSKLQNFFINKKLKDFVKESKLPDLDVNQMTSNNVFKPELIDLYRLYEYVKKNKRTVILEFGSGWSSLIFAIALNELKRKYLKDLPKLRRNNPFELFILETSKKYLNISKKRIDNYFKSQKIKNLIKINYIHSEVKMSELDGRYCTVYKKFPICNPDFFYLDAPGQFDVRNKINNFNTCHKDLMPMVSDINKIEPFLIPGTIIVTDGRGANAKFLKDNFKKNWKYEYDRNYDQHIFQLIDPSLGPLNDNLIKFYNNKKIE